MSPPAKAGAVPKAIATAAVNAYSVNLLFLRIHFSSGRQRECVSRCGRSLSDPAIRSSPSEAGTNTHRLLVTAERTTDGDGGALADCTLVTNGQRAFSPLESNADADPVLGADASGTCRHVQHRRAHRALAVQAPVDVVEPALHVTAERLEVVVPCGELLVGVGVGGAQGLRGRGVGVGIGLGDGGSAYLGAGDCLATGGPEGLPVRTDLHRFAHARSEEHTSELQS